MVRDFLTFCFAVSLLGACSSSEPGFQIVQYTVSGDYDGEAWDMEKHEQILTYSGRGLEALGATITPPDEQPYEYTAVHYLPGVPESIGSDWAKQYEPSDAPTGLRAKTKRAVGEKLLSWGVEPGDPNGMYRIELYINGQLAKTLEYDVRGIPPAAQQGDEDGR